jgi:hypothetical protein
VPRETRQEIYAENSENPNGWNFRVEQFPIGSIEIPSLEEGGESRIVRPKGFHNVRMDTGEVLDTVSERYKLLQNEDLLGAAEEAFAKLNGELGNKFTRKVVVGQGGNTLFADYRFEERHGKLKVGDEVGFGITVKNSFNRTLRPAAEAGAIRCICSNQMCVLQPEVSLERKKHIGEVDVSFIAEAVHKALQNWEKGQETFNRLGGIKVDHIKGLNILERMKSANVISGKTREGVSAIWNQPTHDEDGDRTLWNLYNSVTQYLTHGTDRYEFANKVTADVTKLFDKVARNKKELEKWAKPIEVATVVAV